MRQKKKRSKVEEVSWFVKHNANAISRRTIGVL